MELNDLVRNIQHLIKCPFCGATYEIQHINILDRFKSMFVVHLFCSRCKRPAMAALIVSKNIDFLEEGEEPVTTDDLIEIHQFLKDFDGDFKKLWKKN